MDIKFRLWNKKEGMIYASSLYIFEELGIIEVIDNCGEGHCASFNVMQFTGETDDDGVEIYQGDIVTVERVDGCFGGDNYKETTVVGAPEYIELLGIQIGGPSGYDRVISRKVIGNIYETPELIPDAL